MSRRRRTAAAVGALLLLGLGVVGCGTTYQPRSSRRVGIVVHHGSLVYVQNGREEPIGALGGDLRGLVATTPDAAAHARTARKQFGVGVPSYITGIGAVVVSLTLLSGPVGWVVLGAGACVGVTGLGLMGAGFTNTLDAVNIHNDEVEAAAGAGASASEDVARTDRTTDGTRRHR